jgi:hypothetical protein
MVELLDNEKRASLLWYNIIYGRKKLVDGQGGMVFRCSTLG